MNQPPISSKHQDHDDSHRDKRRQTDKNNLFANTSSDEDGDEPMESSNVPTANRARATSSLVSDDSDGEPYVPPRSVSSGAEDEPDDDLFTTADSSKLAGKRHAMTDAGGASRAKTVAPIRPTARHSASLRATPGGVRAATAAPRAPMMQPDFHIGGPDPANAKPYPMSDIPDKATKLGRPKTTAAAASAKATETSSPNQDARAMSPPMDDELAERHRSEFSGVYGKLLKGHSSQTTLLNDLHNAHEQSLKRTQNLASRRKMRIE